MCCIVCFTMYTYIMASRFRLCKDSYLQVTNHVLIGNNNAQSHYEATIPSAQEPAYDVIKQER
jgi:hypothetical protein